MNHYIRRSGSSIELSMALIFTSYYGLVKILINILTHFGFDGDSKTFIIGLLKKYSKTINSTINLTYLVRWMGLFKLFKKILFKN
ncbi:hypothetical protein BpHYR1_008017 [Brachionus plicatilis]|uniref:Uncharacterized protein n=1 Tax=Brachionus plicatilis TaxID=10195 RepID=A0A3M7R490_BRAPC|nr:hypothetical protein BpHYR1_008017 [Brachionus plicatilis]